MSDPYQAEEPVAILHVGQFTILYQPDKSMQVWEYSESGDLIKVMDFPPAATFAEMYANEDVVKMYLTFS